MKEITTLFTAIGDFFTGSDWSQMVKWPFWILLFTVAAGGVYCARFGKKTLLCQGISGTLNLCGIYQAAVILYTVWPGLRSLPFGLPFLVVTEESVSLVDLMSMNLGTLAPMLLQMMILLFLVDLVESLSPGGKTLMSWLFSQAVTVTISLSAYLIGVAGFNFLLPGLAGRYAIIPVVAAAAVCLVMVCAKFIFTVVLDGGNPYFKSLYGFFTTNKGGSLLTISALSYLLTALLFVVLYATGSSRVTYASANVTGLCIILLLLLVAEYVFAMFYCGKKK